MPLKCSQTRSLNFQTFINGSQPSPPPQTFDVIGLDTYDDVCDGMNWQWQRIALDYQIIIHHRYNY